MGSDRRGSSALVTRGLIAVVTAVILIFLLVYVTNRDTLHARRRTATPAGDSAAGTVTIASDERQTEFGVQIGSNLKAFVADDTFFDGTGEAPETPYTESDTDGVSLVLSEDNGEIVVRVVDDGDTLVTGALFSVSVARKIGSSLGGEIVYVDDDKDGIIRISDFSTGTFVVRLKETDGYHVPQEAYEITVGRADGGTEDSTDGGTEDSTDDDN